MNSHARLLATMAVLVTVIASAPLRGADSTSELRGTVSNRATGDYLGGATVRIEGTTHVAYTERDGSYSLPNLPAGVHTVRVTFPGLDSAMSQITLAAGATRQEDFALTSDIYVMSQFAVSGSREANALAIARQESSDTIMNSVASDAFGSIGQNNIANVLRRLPGVVGDIMGVNVSSISVRGMDEQHTLVNIDGTAGAGASQLTEGIGEAVGSTGRASLPLGSVPAEFIRSVEVVKTPTADMDADSLGGVINLRTKSAFDRSGRTVSLSAAATYNVTRKGDVDPTEGQKYFPSLQVVFGDVYNVFGQQKNLGLFVTGKFYRTGDVTGVSRVDPAPNWDFRGPTLPDRVAFPTSFQFWRTESASLNIKTDYKLAKDSSVGFSAGYTNYKRPKDDMRPRLDGGTRTVGVGPILAESNDRTWVFRNQQLEFLRQVANNQVETWRWNLQGEHRLHSWQITWDLTYSTSKEDAEWLQTQNMTSADLISFIWDRSDFAKPRFIQTGGRDITKNNMDNLTRIRTQGRRDIMTHDVSGARFDVAKRFDRFVLPLKLKAGVRVREEDRDLDLTRFDGEAFPRLGKDFSAYVDKRWTFNWPGGLGNVPMPDTRRFFNDAGIKYLPQGAPGNPALKYAYNPAFVVVTDANIIRDSLRDDWRTKDRISAAFLQGDVELAPKLRLTAGLRFEQTKVTLVKPFEDVRATTVIDRWTQRRTFKSDYDNLFPNLQLRYEPWHRVVLRAAYSETIGRPKITDISGRLVEDDVARIVTFSNPGLKPQHGRNFDLSAEYYFEPVGVVSVGVFRKELDNFITPVTFLVKGNEFGLDLSEYTGWEGRTKRNVGNGTVEGLEFNYSHQLSFLPGMLKGLGIFFNCTTLRSNGDFGELNPPANVPVKSVLPKFRPRSGNLGLSWVYGRWDLRAMWNYTSSYLEIPFLEGTTARDRMLFRGERKQMDFFATFKVTRRFEIFADVLNIGPSNDSAYFGAVYGPRQRDTTWMSTMLTSGIRARF